MPPALAYWLVMVSQTGTCCWTSHIHRGFVTGAGGMLALDTQAVLVLWEEHAWKWALCSLGGGDQEGDVEQHN